MVYLSGRSCFLKITSKVGTSGWCFVLVKIYSFWKCFHTSIYSVSRHLLNPFLYKVLIAENKKKKSILSAFKKLIIYAGNIYINIILYLNINIMVIVWLEINTKVKPQAVCMENTKEKWLILISGIKGRLPGRVDIWAGPWGMGRISVGESRKGHVRLGV